VFSIGVTLYFMILGKLPYPTKVRSLVLANKECQFYFEEELQKAPQLLDLLTRTICPLK